MASGLGEPMLRQIGQLFGVGTASGLDGPELLARFVRTGDDAAFEALVRRHGPMVLAVCRRSIGDAHAAEDAFQATFLVLARRARSIRDADRLGPWLYGVARRVASRSRAELVRRRSRERGGEAVTSHEPVDRPPVDPSLGPELDVELSRLPRAYRDVVILCDLEGLTHDEASRQLGWPVGTVKGRLHRARNQLRERLESRGVGMASGPFLAAMARDARLPVPEVLLHQTVRAATAIAAGGSLVAAGSVPASTLGLADGVVRTMIWTKVGTVSMAACGLLAVVGGAAAHQFGAGLGGDAPQGAAVAAAPAVESQEAKLAGRVLPSPGSPSPDPFGVPAGQPRAGDPAEAPDPFQDPAPGRTPPAGSGLPAESRSPFELDAPAVNRTAQNLARQKLDVAQKTYERLLGSYLSTQGNLNDTQRSQFENWERRWKESWQQPGVSMDVRIDALRRHLDWLTAYETDFLARSTKSARTQLDMSRQQGVVHPKPPPENATDEEVNRWITERVDEIPTTAILKYLRLEVQMNLAQLGANDGPQDPLSAPPPEPRAASPASPFEADPPVPAEPKAASPADPSQEDQPVPGPPKVAGPPALSDRTKAVLDALNRPLIIKVEPELTLDLLLTGIRQGTKGPDLPEGLPLYVDPAGLREAGVTTSAPLKSVFSAEGVPLRTSLEWLLHGIGLNYVVRHDIVQISNENRLSRADRAVEGYGFRAVEGRNPFDPSPRGGRGRRTLSENGTDENTRNAATRSALERVVSVKLSETPLKTALAGIFGTDSRDPLSASLPFLVDAPGLDAAGMTMDSPVTMELDGVSARAALSLALEQLDLAYGVVDGLIVIGASNDLSFRQRAGLPPLAPIGQFQ